jgi:hypothetical protein
MTTITSMCRRCGIRFEPDRRAIVFGPWRLCPDCFEDAGTTEAPARVCSIRSRWLETDHHHWEYSIRDGREPGGLREDA